MTTGSKIEIANAFQQQGKLEKARELYREILARSPDDESALFGSANLAMKAGNPKIASALFSKAIEVNKLNAKLFHNRGRTFAAQQEYSLAISDYSTALELTPASPLILSDRAICFSHLQDYNNALKDFNQAIRFSPTSSNLFYNRAVVSGKAGEFDSAISDYTKAIQLDPCHYLALHNRGLMQRSARRFNRAIEDFQLCLQINPNCYEALWNKSLTHLMIGEYEIGWKLYEHRWDTKNFTSKKPNYQKPLWIGYESLIGKTILLHSEQGLGDTIQFSRYIKNFDQKKCNVILEVEKPLMRIMASILPSHKIFEKGAYNGKFDFHCPLMSLPLAFQTRVDTIPFNKPYLNVEANIVNNWRMQLGEKLKPRIGIAWQGNPDHNSDHLRSIPLGEIINEMCHDFEWFSLQRDITESDRQTIKQHIRITHFGNEIGDFAKTGALCSLLDAVISVDTSLAHLSAAIGQQTHLLLSEYHDWRWLQHQSKSPWYSTVYLHRKNEKTIWSALFNSVISELKRSLLKK